MMSTSRRSVHLVPDLDDVDLRVNAWSGVVGDADPLVVDAYERLREMGRAMVEAYIAVEREERLHHRDADVLLVLMSDPDRGWTSSELRYELGLSTGNISHRVKALEYRRWITQVRRDGDRRVKEVRLTSAGSEAATRILHRRTEIQHSILSSVPRDLLHATSSALRALSPYASITVPD